MLISRKSIIGLRVIWKRLRSSEKNMDLRI
jgi:hypothetical protein